MIPEGIHPKVSDETYHRRVLGIASNTALKLVRRSPAHYKAWIDGTLPSEDTPALAFGRAFDCALLTPDVFERHYIERPDFGDLRLKDNRAAKKAFDAEHDGLTPVSFDDMLTIRNMIESIKRHPLAGTMVRDGQPQMTLSWKDKESGLRCKSRLDYYVRSLAMIVDVKTCDDASEEGFRKAVAKYGYATQDALYRAAAAELGLPITHFVFLAVEKAPPYAVATYTLDAEAIGLGYSRVRRDIETLAHCIRSNRWPAYREAIVELSLPPWAA